MEYQIFNAEMNEVVKLANAEGIKRVPNKNEVNRGLKYQAPNQQGKYEGLINSQYVVLSQVKDKRTGKNIKQPIIVLFNALQADFIHAKAQYNAYLLVVAKKGQSAVNRNTYLTKKDSLIIQTFYGNHEVSIEGYKKFKFTAPTEEKDYSIIQKVKHQYPDRIVMAVFIDEVQKELIFPEKFFISVSSPEYQVNFDKMVSLIESKRKVTFQFFAQPEVEEIVDSNEELEIPVVSALPKRPVKKDFTINDVFDSVGYNAALSKYNSYKQSQKKAEITENV